MLGYYKKPKETADAIIDYCRGKVASFKMPRYVIFIEEFPMTASGKIRKVELRAEAKRRLAPPDELAAAQ